MEKWSVMRGCAEHWSEVKWGCSVVSNSCDLMNCSPPGFSIQGIFQARVPEWVAIPFSRGSSHPRDPTQISCIAGRCFTLWATREVQLLLSTSLDSHLTYMVGGGWKGLLWGNVLEWTFEGLSCWKLWEKKGEGQRARASRMRKPPMKRPLGQVDLGDFEDLKTRGPASRGTWRPDGLYQLRGGGRGHRHSGKRGMLENTKQGKMIRVILLLHIWNFFWAGIYTQWGAWRVHKCVSHLIFTWMDWAYKLVILFWMKPHTANILHC